MICRNGTLAGPPKLSVWRNPVPTCSPSGGTRTVHRLTSALEDAGWIIRDMLVWAYATGFPKSKASLKPSWEPIVMARKAGALRDLAIDECRLPTDGEGFSVPQSDPAKLTGVIGRRWASGSDAGT